MKVSIITPCHNAEKTVARTLESVVSQIQDGFEIEYIFMDGLSQDSTFSIIKEYEQKYSFIKAFSEKDHSMTEALNKGFRMATGDIVASINADDIYLPDTLAKVVEHFERHSETDVLMANTYFVDDLSQKVLSKNMPRYFKPWLCALTECPFPECAVFFRRSSLENTGFFDEQYKYTQDFEFYLRLYYQGKKFVWQDIDSSCFFRGKDNYSSTITDKMDAEVKSYFSHATIFGLCAGSWLSKVLKIIFGIRKYYFSDKFLYTELTKGVKA